MFYNDKIVAVNYKDELQLFRRIKNEIIRYEFNINSTEVMQETIINDSNGEFDVNFYKEKIYLIYKDFTNRLRLYDIDKKKFIKVIDKLNSEIYELQILTIDSIINIIYLERVPGENANFYIKHILLNEEQVEDHIADKIKSSNFVSPLKAIKIGNSIIIVYYYLNHICIKEYDVENNIWSASTILTDNSNKLYCDFIILDNYLHLVYSDFSEENFQVRYNRFKIKADNIIKEEEVNISDYGNNIDPIVIFYEGKLWVVWKGTNTLLSKYSIDNGKTFSEMTVWQESKSSHMVKYKYISDYKENNNIVYFSYGAFYPDLKFMGFE